MKRSSKLLAPALLLTLMAFWFRFDSAGVTWMWEGNVPVAVVLLVTGLAFWVAFAWRRISDRHGPTS